MTHHDDDRHQLIPDTARGPREDVTLEPHPKDCGHVEHMPHPLTSGRIGRVEPSGHEGATWVPCTAVPAPDVRGVEAARVARYAGAIDAATIAQIGPDLWGDEARAVMTVADAEQAELRAELDRLTNELDRERLSVDYRPDGVDIVMGKLQEARSRAEAAEVGASKATLDMEAAEWRADKAEAALADLRAKVEALADEWGAGEPKTFQEALSSFKDEESWAYARRLRAVLEGGR